MKVVKKHVRMEYFNRSLSEPCKVRVSKLDAYKKQIDGWLEGDKQKWKKQRHTAMRIFNWLVEEHPDFDCSYQLYIAKKKELYGGGSEFYVTFEYISGEAQVNFGKAAFYDGNVCRQGCYVNTATQATCSSSSVRICSA